MIYVCRVCAIRKEGIPHEINNSCDSGCGFTMQPEDMIETKGGESASIPEFEPYEFKQRRSG